MQRRTVAITGGARGIGLATGEAFARAGARVALGDVDEDLVRTAAQGLATATGGQVVGLPLDVTDRGSFAAFLAATEAHIGTIDTMVNNAGIMPTGLFVDEVDTMTDLMVAINVTGVLIGSKLFAQRFTGRGGTIVNVASLAGVSAHRGVATYCATKHAVVGFSEALRYELETSGILVTVVLPGIVRTELSAGNSSPRWARTLTEAEPGEVAAAIVDAVLLGRDKVVVPRALGPLLTVMRLLPAPVRRRVDRVARLDTAFTAVNPTLRAGYHQRLAGLHR